jgi:hypothetical protein
MIIKKQPADWCNYCGKYPEGHYIFYNPVGEGIYRIIFEDDDGEDYEYRLHGSIAGDGSIGHNADEAVMKILCLLFSLQLPQLKPIRSAHSFSVFCNCILCLPVFTCQALFCWPFNCCYEVCGQRYLNLDPSDGNNVFTTVMMSKCNCFSANKVNDILENLEIINQTIHTNGGTKKCLAKGGFNKTFFQHWNGQIDTLIAYTQNNEDGIVPPNSSLMNEDALLNLMEQEEERLEKVEGISVQDGGVPKHHQSYQSIIPTDEDEDIFERHSV